MYDELEDYNSKDHFFFTDNTDLEKVCNAPKNGIGVYLVYALKNGRIQLVYIGSSGKIQQNGKKKPGSQGLWEELVNGKQFGSSRKISWKEKLLSEKIEALDVYWYVTFNKNFKDLPAMAEALVMQRYYDMNECLPLWNEEF